jgi:FkbM family methyltransferase
MSYKHDLHNDRFFDIIFERKQGGYFVEVGGFQGVVCSQTYFLEQERGWKGIVVEPNPRWKEDLDTQRNCKIVTQPVSDTIEKVKFLVHKEQPEYSKIDDGNYNLPPGEIQTLDMESITLSKLFEKENSPKEIDVLCIDIEGLELRALEEFFQNSDRQINLITLEHGDTHQVINFFYNKPYVKIKNPYLSFLRIDKQREKVVRYVEGEFINLDGDVFDGNPLDLEPINWEYYFLHIDMLKKYPSLKKLIVPIDYFNLNT